MSLVTNKSYNANCDNCINCLLVENCENIQEARFKLKEFGWGFFKNKKTGEKAIYCPTCSQKTSKSNSQQLKEAGTETP